MGDDHAAPGDLRCYLGQHTRDVLVGQTVEAVAANAVVVKAARQREPVGELGMAAVERGIEAGHLRQLRLDRGDRPDAAEIVRLMQRRERTERLELGEHRGRDAHWRCELGAAMHDAVTDPEQGRPVTEMLAQPAADHAKERVVTGARLVRKPAVDQYFASATRCGAVPMPST
jgi:hypothetical protein